MRRILSAVFAIAALGAGTAHGYSNLFAFGDSLSDGGNAFFYAPPSAALPLGWPPFPAPGSQRFSNGPTAVELLAPKLGLPPLLPSTAGGRNYAVGGATTGTLNFNFEIGSPPGLPATLGTTGMQAQAGQFLGAPPAFDPATSLFFLWGGPNDVFLAAATGGDVEAAAGQAVMNLAGLVVGLAGAGAQHFVVLNMPDLGVTPAGAASNDPAGLTLLSQGFNAGLNVAMGQVETAYNLDITVFDTFALLSQVTATPAAFDLTNVTSPCLTSISTYAAGCPGFLYFDEVHPTTFTHAILANALNTTLVPEPETWAMLAVGLLALAAAARRRRTA